MTEEEREVAKRAILDKYARKKVWNRNTRKERTTDVPAACGPNRIEREREACGGRTPTGVGKVIFDDLTSAEAAARELGELFGTGFETYECHRSRHGHRHLRTPRARDEPV